VTYATIPPILDLKHYHSAVTSSPCNCTRNLVCVCFKVDNTCQRPTDCYMVTGAGLLYFLKEGVF